MSVRECAAAEQGSGVEPLHLIEAELDRRIAAEDRHEHSELLRGRLHIGNDGHR